MPRPRKCKRICFMPLVNQFGPIGEEYNNIEFIFLTLEEYEVIRLIDLDGLSQEEASEQMGAARTTIQNIYFSARKKIADSLVNGKMLKLQGGNYQICDGRNNRCRRNCRKKEF